MELKAPAVNLSAGAMLAGLGLLAVAFYVTKKGGLVPAASAAGAAVVEAAGAAVSGAVGAVGQGVGLPTPAETVTDAAVARWIIDNRGQMEASKWASAPAYLSAQFMAAGSGRPPDPMSPAGRALGLTAGDFARADRLAGYYIGPDLGSAAGTGRDLGAPGWDNIPTP